ncbi:amidohydrolase [bacterium]|nr:amidohydrolase [bacterium]
MKFKILSEYIDQIWPEIVKVRRDLHRIPEEGFKEHKTSAYVKKFLKKLKCFKITSTAKTGIIASFIYDSKKDHSVAFRADMDGLSIEEENDVPYKSTHPGMMHACGHDVHTANLLGLAKIISKFKDHIDLNIKLFFQPAEEGPGGAVPMIEEGAMLNPTVKRVYGLHVTPSLKTGEIGIKKGQIFSATANFKFTFKGKSAHASRPNLGNDSICAASHFIISSQTYLSRLSDPFQPSTVNFGTIQGGTRTNIIPQSTTIEGTIRHPKKNGRNKIYKALVKLANASGTITGSKAYAEWEEGYDPVINDDAMSEKLIHHLIPLLGKKKVKILEKFSLGGEDFGYFLNHSKGCFFYLGTSSNHIKDRKIHNSFFDVDENCLKIGMISFSSIIFSKAITPSLYILEESVEMGDFDLKIPD